MCSNEKLWGGRIILIGHSFGGLVIKSLVVEVGKLSLAATKINLKQEQRLIALGFWKTFQG
jgi:hypothetical protein